MLRGRGSIKLARAKLAQASKKQLIFSIIIAILSISLLIVGLAFVWKYKEDIDNIAYYNKHGEWRDTCKKVCSATYDVPPLILISLDGFRADYLERNITPAIERMMHCGTSAPYMFPSFPASTYPNHYTMVTGLYPESHGIVDNKFLDSRMKNGVYLGENITTTKFGDEFRYTRKFGTKEWYKGEPIWNTVNFAGKKTGTFFWPGSEVEIQGSTPTYKATFSDVVPFSQRVDTVIEWLTYPTSDRPSFFTLYFEQPDGVGHTFGPDSNEVNSNMIFVDAMLNYLFHRLDQQQLLGCVNIVLVSDHGMQSLRPDHFVKLYEYEKLMASPDVYIEPVAGAHIYLKGELAKMKNPLEAFPKLMCHKGENFRAYTKKTMPRGRHYTERRIGDIFIDTAIGSLPFTNKTEFETWKNKGGHGYNNIMKSMRSIFGAIGPSFKPKAIIPPFQNIELYNLFVDVLQLPNRAPNNGTHGLLFTTLNNPPEYPQSQAFPFPKCEVDISLMKCGDSCHFKLPLSNASYCYPSQSLGFDERLDPSLCEAHFCNSSLILDAEQKPIVAESFLRHPIANIDHRANCSLKIHDGNMTECKRKSFKGTISLFPRDSIHFYFEQARISAPIGFIDGAWKSLVDLVSKYTRHYATLKVWAGPIWDNDNDGLADVIDKQGKNASHVFVVLLRCSGGEWHERFTHCKDETKTRVLSLVLPLIEKDDNCLNPTEYLFQNMVRVRDVELLTGLEFFIDRNYYSSQMALQLRAEVKEELWQLEHR